MGRPLSYGLGPRRSRGARLGGVGEWCAPPRAKFASDSEPEAASEPVPEPAPGFDPAPDSASVRDDSDGAENLSIRALGSDEPAGVLGGA